MEKPFNSQVLVILYIMNNSSNIQETKGSAPRREPTELDLDKIVDQIQRHKDGYEKVKGKEICFFFGKTGSGKTTTINYLSGREMFFKTISTTNPFSKTWDEEVIECKDPIPGFTIGHQMKSETSVIHIYECSRSGLLYCDSPGLGDTGGIEVDIANAVGISNTLLNSSSVRIVFVMNGNDVGTDRGQVFKEFLQLITRFVRIDLHMNSLCVLFTKDSQVKTLIRSLNKLEEEEHIQEDPTLNKLVTYLIDYVEKNREIVLVDPLDPNKREEIINMIKNTNPIISNLETFDFPLSSIACSLLRERTKGLFSLALSSLSKKDLKTLEDCLSDLKLLAVEVRMDEISNLYAECLHKIEEAISNLSTEIKNNLEGQNFKSTNECMVYLRKTRSLQKVMDLNFDNLYDYFRAEINEKTEHLEKESKEEESYLVISSKLATLQKIHEHLSSYLLENNQEAFIRVKNLIKLRVEEQNRDIDGQIQQVQAGNFSEEQTNNLMKKLAVNLNLLSKIEHLSEFLPESYWNLYKEKTKTLANIILNSYTKFGQLISSENTSTELKTTYEIIKKIEETHELVLHIPREKYKYSEIFRTLEDKVNELRKRMETHAYECNYLLVSEDLSLLKAFLRIDIKFGMEFETKNLSHSVELIEKEIKTTQEEVWNKVHLEIFETSGSIEVYSSVNDKIKILQSAKNLEKELSDPGSISTFLSKLKDKFMGKVHKLSAEVSKALNENNFILSSHSIKNLKNLLILQYF